MITRAEIDAQPSDLDPTTISMLITEVRGSVQYTTTPALFSDLAAKLADADGTVIAQMLKAALVKLEGIGEGVAALQGGANALYYDQKEAKAVWRKYILDLLYPHTDGIVAVDMTNLTVDDLISMGFIAGFQATQRDICGEFV